MAKNYFFKVIKFSHFRKNRKKTAFSQDLKVMFFFSTLCYFWIYGPRPFFLKKRSLSYDIFGDRGIKLFFSKWTKKTFFFPRNVDIYVDMEYSELGRHSKTLMCCGRAWKYKVWETHVCIRSLECCRNIFYSWSCAC